METTTLKVTGMSCGMCVQHVTKALQAIAGVRSVEVDLDSGRATVEHEAGVTAAPLIAAVEEEGYSAQARENVRS